MTMIKHAKRNVTTAAINHVWRSAHRLYSARRSCIQEGPVRWLLMSLWTLRICPAPEERLGDPRCLSSLVELTVDAVGATA
jgi:hypothetical protein